MCEVAAILTDHTLLCVTVEQIGSVVGDNEGIIGYCKVPKF